MTLHPVNLVTDLLLDKEYDYIIQFSSMEENSLPPEFPAADDLLPNGKQENPLLKRLRDLPMAQKLSLLVVVLAVLTLPIALQGLYKPKDDRSRADTVVTPPTPPTSPTAHLGPGEKSEVSISMTVENYQASDLKADVVLTVNGDGVKNLDSLTATEDYVTSPVVRFTKTPEGFISGKERLGQHCFDLKTTYAAYIASFCMNVNGIGGNYYGTINSADISSMTIGYDQYIDYVVGAPLKSVGSLSAAYDKNTPNFKPTNFTFVLEESVNPASITKIEVTSRNNMLVDCTMLSASLGVFTSVSPDENPHYFKADQKSVTDPDHCSYSTKNATYTLNFSQFNNKYIALLPLVPDASPEPTSSPSPNAFVQMIAPNGRERLITKSLYRVMMNSQQVNSLALFYEQAVSTLASTLIPVATLSPSATYYDWLVPYVGNVTYPAFRMYLEGKDGSGNAVSDYSDDYFYILLSSSPTPTPRPSSSPSPTPRPSATPSPTPTVKVRFPKATGKGSESKTLVSVQVSLSATINVPVTVEYQVTDISATNGVDYTLTNGTLTIPAGKRNAYINPVVVNDTLKEPNESFRIKLVNPVNALLGAQTTYTYTITNND